MDWLHFERVSYWRGEAPQEETEERRLITFEKLLSETKLYFRLSALLKQIQYGWGGKGSGNLKDLCEAINKLEYDEVVKHDLMEQLTKWPQTKGFRLQKPNKEILRLLLEAFLSNDISVTKQVNDLESGSSPG